MPRKLAGNSELSRSLTSLQDGSASNPPSVSSDLMATGKLTKKVTIVDAKDQLAQSTSQLPLKQTVPEPETLSTVGISLLNRQNIAETKVNMIVAKAFSLFNSGHYHDALTCCETAYDADAYRTDNLLLLGAIHFQLRNFSESIFYNQQSIRVDPNFAEGYSNLGNALKELGDINASIQFYLKAIKLKPRYCDAYNNLACAYMQLGKNQEAMETYQMALVLNPALVDAHSNLGNLYKANGDLEASKKCYLEAIRIKPDFPIAWNNLAGVFKEEGQLASAIAYYREAIRLCPEFADAHSNLGNALKDQGKLDDALACYTTAIKLRPDFAIAHGNIGSCYYEMGNINEAIKAFKYSIQLEPNFPDAHNNLGNALREDGRVDEAILCYRTALRLKPDHPHAYNNLGNSLKDKGFVKEAIHCYVTAIRLLPTFAAAHCNLGSILKEQWKHDQALSHFHEAIIIDPLFADAYSNMGNTYKEINKHEDAIKCYLTAVKIKPIHAEAYSNLAACYKDIGKYMEAIQYYRQALQCNQHLPDAIANLAHSNILVCDWNTYDEDFTKVAQIIQLQNLQRTLHHISNNASNSASAQALSASSVSGQSPAMVVPSLHPQHALCFPFSLAELLLIAQSYSYRTIMNVCLYDHQRYIFRPKPKNIRFKIGYVSSDFGNHPLSHSIQSLFALHDRAHFDVTCYALTSSDQSSWRHKIENEVETFKDLSLLHPADAAQLIANDNVHILVNLNGYTKGARNEIFAMHPAPVQISFLGYSGTMGSDFMEYIVADPISIPEHLKQFYSEKVISLPHTYCINDHKQSCRDILEMKNMPVRAQYGLSEDSFVFCNFNQLYKIDSAIFEVWMNILKRVPNSVLWLLRFPSAGEDNIKIEARKRGIRDDQLVFSDVVPKADHIKRGFLADLFLDTPNYSAQTTALDILWSGTPLIALPQEKMVSRASASILHSIGLDELITSSYAQYEELAVTLAQDSERLFSMRRHIEAVRENCAAYDTARFVHNLEEGYIRAWHNFEVGSHDHIAVEDSEEVYKVGDANIFA